MDPCFPKCRCLESSELLSIFVRMCLLLPLLLETATKVFGIEGCRQKKRMELGFFPSGYSRKAYKKQTVSIWCFSEWVGGGGIYPKKQNYFSEFSSSSLVCTIILFKHKWLANLKVYSLWVVFFSVQLLKNGRLSATGRFQPI